MDYQKIKILLDKIKLSAPKVLVLGDIMLDCYMNGSVRRISPEAPVPILNYQNETSVLGGAGNVLHNLSNLGAKLGIASVIGNDLSGEQVMSLVENLKVPNDSIYISNETITTKKTRFISYGTQLLRLDHDSKAVSGFPLEFLEKKILNRILSFDCVVISDYGKGVCEDSMIQAIIKESNIQGIPTLIDPKGSSWNKYSKATGITPNKREVEEKFNINLKIDEDFEKIAKIIINKYKLKFCLITRGADGMTYLEKNKIFHQKVGKKEVFDVSGAGDTVISSLAASFCAGIKIENALALSSYISSEVVTYAGTTPFHSRMLKKYER